MTRQKFCRAALGPVIKGPPVTCDFTNGSDDDRSRSTEIDPTERQQTFMS
jgi:hypothetical protein